MRGLLTLGLLSLGLAALGLAGLDPTGLWPGGLPAAAGKAPVRCDGAYVVHSERSGAASTLSRLDLHTGRTTDLARLDWHVNALGYAAEQQRFYAIGRQAGPGGRGPRVLTIDATGHTTDLGPVRDGGIPVPLGGLGDVYVGTIWRQEFYLLAGDRLLVVDVDPAGADYLEVTRTVDIDGPLWLGDWDFDPADGGLWGAVPSPGRATVVRVDPVTGRVASFPDGSGLPGGSWYGAAFMAPGRTLYLLDNNIATGQRTYRVPLTGSTAGVAEPLDGGPARWASADGAYCPAAQTRPPAPPPSQPPPSVAPAPAGPAAAGQIPDMSPTPTPQPTRARPVPVRAVPAAVPPVVPRRPTALHRRPAPDRHRWPVVTVVALMATSLIGVRAMGARRR